MTDFDLRKLAPLTWRGLRAFAVTDAGYEVTHRLAERKYPFLDVAGHDNIGRDSAVMPVTLLFVESLKPGLFTKDWPKFRAALDDTSSGPFTHPDRGGMVARVARYSLGFPATSRQGGTVQVTWIETRDDPDQPVNAASPSPEAKAVAKAADADIAALRIKYPNGLGATDLALAQVPILYPDGESEGGSVFDLINGIIGSMNSLGLALAGKVTQAVLLIDQMVTGIEELNDPTAWPAINNLIQAAASLQHTADKVLAAERPTGKKTLTVDITLDQFADMVGNSVEEVAGLNPSALLSSLVDKGTTLTYFTA